MFNKPRHFFRRKIKDIVIGKPMDPADRGIFHHLSLIALFAWVGLGADGLSSSCYGPEQTYLALLQYPSLVLFVAIAMVATIFIISESYCQIIELFPTGGGGYLVASKLLSPTVGMISGCALLVDYVLTIAISVASGSEALFSLLPVDYQPFKIFAAIIGVILLMVLNMRGAKESVFPLIPVFMIFLLTHAFTILYSIAIHLTDVPVVLQSVESDITRAHSQIGFMGILFLVLKAYGIGAGSYTGIEAVSNSLNILREPRVQTGRKTMQYMAVSLAFTAGGLLLAYVLFNLRPMTGKTMNAVLFETMTSTWPGYTGEAFVLVTLVSEAVLLFVAAQTGFLGGPSVLANMATDRWFPSRFSSLSDRLVTQNGVILMSLAAIGTIVFTHGSVYLLVILYSINVFITFCLSQLGMVRYWWKHKHASKWKKRISINGLGLALSTFILFSVFIFKYYDGGWVTIPLTGGLVLLALMIKRHYNDTSVLLRRLEALVATASADVMRVQPGHEKKEVAYDPKSRTAVLMVNGFNGLGLHTLFNVIRFFGSSFKNFVFVQIGVIDAGNFKGIQEVDNLKEKVRSEVQRYVELMKHNGYYAEGFTSIGIDAISEIEKEAEIVSKKFGNAVFFGGQLVFPEETLASRLLHNYTVFTIQRRFYQKGIPFVLIPIRV